GKRRGWGIVPVNQSNVQFWLARLDAPFGSRVDHQVEKRHQARFGRVLGAARELPSLLLRLPIESILRSWRDILRPFSWERPLPLEGVSGLLFYRLRYSGHRSALF